MTKSGEEREEPVSVFDFINRRLSKQEAVGEEKVRQTKLKEAKQNEGKSNKQINVELYQMQGGL